MQVYTFGADVHAVAAALYIWFIVIGSGARQ